MFNIKASKTSLDIGIGNFVISFSVITAVDVRTVIISQHCRRKDISNNT